MATRYQEFGMRRLHSLTGMAPMGVFLFEHFFTNSYSHKGEAVFNEKVAFLRGLPYLYFIEYLLLFGPFLFHIAYGLKIMYSGEYVIRDSSHKGNFLYFLQRATAIPALAFIAYHLATTRFGGHGDDPNFFRIMTHKFENPWVVGAYILGILSICFHFANGIRTFCITWGLTVTPASQRYVGYACVAVGIVLAGMAINSIFGFRPENFAKAAERMKDAPQAISMWMGALHSAAV